MVRFTSQVLKILFSQIVYPMCEYFCIFVSCHSFIILYAYSCTVIWECHICTDNTQNPYPQFFPCKSMHWSLTVDLIALIKVQLRAFSLKFVLIEATSTCSNRNLIKYGLSTSQVGSLCSFQLYLIIGTLYKSIVFALYLWSNVPYFGVKLVPFIVLVMNNHLDISKYH